MRNRISSSMLLILILTISFLQCSKKVDLMKVFEKFMETFNTHDAGALASLFTEDAIIINPGEPEIRGRQAIEENYKKNVFQSWPDINLEPDLIFTSGEYIAVECVISGTFNPPLLEKEGETPSPIKKAVFKTVVILKVAQDGLISEARGYK